MIMEDHETAREESQASLAALQRITVGERNNNNGGDQDNHGNGDRRSKLRDF
jgi:hypothetical protein